MKVLKVYLEIISAASERLWSLTSEHSTTEQAENESDEFSDDFDHFVATAVKLSDKEHYGFLICKIFLKDCLVELFLMHLTNSCHTPDEDVSEAEKSLLKLAESVAQMLAKFAESMLDRLPVDEKHRVKISEYFTEKLTTLLAASECSDFVCSTDFVGIVNSFVPVVSLSVLERLIVLLLHSPENCVVDQLVYGSRTLSHRGRLMVNALRHILNQVDLVQPEALTDISVRLCKILKLVPSDDMICSSLTAVAKQMPQFVSNITPSVVSSLLKSAMEPSLDLMMSLAVENESCKQLMIEWFTAHKAWKRKDHLPSYVDAVLFVLTACEKGI